LKPFYFVSDLHLGTRGDEARRERFTAFLAGIRDRAAGLFILGDLFEFGFEYRSGLIERNRAIAEELAQVVKSGVRVALVRGNHDCWLRARFQETYGIELLNSPVELVLAGRRVLLSHGDELDRSFKTRVTSALFRSRVACWLFSLLPERLGLKLASMIAGLSRASGIKPKLVKSLRFFAGEQLQRGFDCVMLGHVHVPALEQVGAGSYLNTGDWITHFTYGVMDAQGLELRDFRLEEQTLPKHAGA
jgi:UDP-2,3-diacylglucosamine hydrolase